MTSPNTTQIVAQLTRFAVIGLAAAAASAASAQTPFGIGGSGVDSDDLGPVGPWYAQNCTFWSSGTWGVVAFTYTGSTDFPVGNLRIMGQVVSNDTFTRPNELRFAVCNLDTSTHFFSGAIHPSSVAGWTTPIFVAPSTTGGMDIQDGSSLGTIHPGDHLEIRFYESADLTVGADATWNTVQVMFFPKPPPITFDGGSLPIAHAADGNNTDTNGSDYDTQMGLYDPNGMLIDFNDDGLGTVGGPSLISLDNLTAGEYYLCVTGPGASFDDGYAVIPPTPGVAGGTLIVNYPDGTFETSTMPESAVWFRLIITDPECDGDVNGDHMVNIADLGAVLASFGSMCP